MVSLALPVLILLILDDSGSHQDELPGTNDPKWMWVDRYTAVIFKELLARSTELKGDTAQIKPRYFVYVIIYGSTPQVWGSGEMNIKSAVEKYANDGNSFGLGGKLGGTNAVAAFQMAYDYLKEAVRNERFRGSFPPIVFHLTDGMSDTDEGPIAEQIKQLFTDDGNVLVVNAYIGTQTNLSYKGPEDFPGYINLCDVGTNEDNVRLFNMSSEMPSCIRQNLVNDGIFPALKEGARLFFDVRTKEMLKHTIQVVGSVGSRADRTTR